MMLSEKLLEDVVVIVVGSTVIIGCWSVVVVAMVVEMVSVIIIVELNVVVGSPVVIVDRVRMVVVISCASGSRRPLSDGESLERAIACIGESSEGMNNMAMAKGIEDMYEGKRLDR